MTLIEHRTFIEAKFREALAKEVRAKQEVIKWRNEFRLVRDEERAEFQELMFQSA